MKLFPVITNFSEPIGYMNYHIIYIQVSSFTVTFNLSSVKFMKY